MFHFIKEKLNNNNRNHQTLPGSYYPNNNKRWNVFSSSHGYRDGSASSIHTAPTLQQAWKRSSTETKATWISIAVSVFMVYFGYRWIRYSNAGLKLNCNSLTCDLEVTPVGWGRRVSLLEIPRHQVQPAYAVKTTRNGDFVTDKNIQLIDRYDPKEKKKKKKGRSSAYKGPDENGHYLSYAIVLTDKGESEAPEHPHAYGNRVESLPPTPEVKLDKLKHLLQRYQKEDGKSYYRLIPRQLNVRQSKRRVRTMVQKVESYAKRRRQKLVVKESSAPSWQGVLLIVFGVVILLITIILGQFQEPVQHSGPGMRRQQHHKPSSTRDAYSRTTPRQYEVSTQPSAGVSSGYRRNNTTARKRGK